MIKKKAYIFDLWNTLIVKKGRKETDMVSEHFGLDRNEVHEWIRISSVGKNAREKYRVFELLCMENDIEFTERDKSFVDELYDEYLRECEWIEGAKELIVSLKEKGYRVGILSNTTDLSHSVLEHFDLDKMVDHVVLSCDVGYLKPDPRIFQSILDEMNLKNNEVVMIGDKITTDILGAKTMNIDSILFEPRIDNKKIIYNSSINGVVNKISDVAQFA